MHDRSGMNDPRELEDAPTSSLGDVVRRIATDVRTIAGDELQLAKHELKASRRMVGNYVTSLDMAGCSITVTLLDAQLTSLWDAPVHTPALRW